MATERVLAATRRARWVRAWREGLSAPWDALLVPGALAYRGGLALRRAAYASGVRRSRSVPCAVVAVGNLTVGGTGKTPLVELIARRLTARRHRVVILSRGYGRRESAPVSAVSDGTRLLLSPPEAGDEPIVLARRLPGVPVVVGRDRHRAAVWAIPRFHPDVLLLDDGFQHMRLRKDVEVVCLDAREPWGRGGLLPRGSLREPPSALARAHLLMLTHSRSAPDLDHLHAELRRWAPEAPVALGLVEAEGVEELGTGAVRPVEALRGSRCLAFAGIAVPENFSATLAELGVAAREFLAFPDHHRYDARDRAALESHAQEIGADLLLTTEKDAVRLPPAGAMPVWSLRIRLRLGDEDERWWAALETRLGRR